MAAHPCEFVGQEIAESPPRQVLFSSTALSKGKRSKRSRVSESSSETMMPKSEELSDDEELQQEVAARCLLMMRCCRSASPTTSESRQEPLTCANAEAEAPRRRIKKPRKLEEDEAGNNNNMSRVYECKSCGKGFLSFQALGGHRATCQNKLRHASGFAEAFDNGSFLGDKVHSNSNNKTHECPVCHRVFPSGQALGGHRRTHSSPVVPAATLEPACTNLSATEFRSPYSKLMLDLNVPAAEDDFAVSDDLGAQLPNHESSGRPWWIDGEAVRRGREDEAESEVDRNRGGFSSRAAPDLTSKSNMLLVATVI